MEQSFCFVNGTQIDRATKAKMRRHVMLGKNVGKTIHRRSKRDLYQYQNTKVAKAMKPSSSSLSVKHGLSLSNRRAILDYYTPDRIYSNVLAGFQFPAKLTPHFAEVISDFFLFIAHKLYPMGLGISMEKSKYTWMSILMSDKAAFYCNIALMQACNELFLGEGEGSPTAMYHLSNSLTYVRERLESSEALSDSTMGIVMSLITQEQCRQQHKAARIHMDGLARMIELRGGLESLEGCLPVLLKACKTDLMFTLQRDDPPRFHRDNMPHIIATLNTMNLPFDREAALLHLPHPDLSPALLDVLVDVQCTSTLFNSRPAAKKIDLYFFQEILVSIFYRLRAIPYSEENAGIGDAYHVGLTLFMMTLFLQVGKDRIMYYDNVTKRLRDILETELLEDEEGLKLWLLMVGGVWVLEDEDVDWLVEMLGNQLNRMSLAKWEDVKRVVMRWPWISGLHDKSGKAVWDKALKQAC